ncbi:hypothetical protein O6H91_09G118100 [Diphasiastrum complanatum]|uniref:Uncharacterized protein n=1 Tax=Diphasiastrum complanatum TaxID=34168 RepID=A0ACC2CU31_DIPCM|nr:hypothetical protein O6H91_09G118100 [Diphasiastrum complanatum]
MGMEVPTLVEANKCVKSDDSPLQNRPSIFLVGSPDVGKRSIIDRLLGSERASEVVSLGDVTGHGWMIDTKYYTANVCIWIADIYNKHINAGTKGHSLLENCEALVMVFDLSNPSSFAELQEWASGVDLHAFEILLCVGNKADCLPDHFGHSEYRRRLEKHGESSSDPHPEYADFGIQRSEGASLLEVEQYSVDDIKGSYLDWCTENGIEYIEACAINEAFDHCMSVNGDMQGVARLQGALSAHMWPGMTVKPLDKLTETAYVKPEEGEDSSGFSTDSDSDYTIEYELLSNNSGDICEDEHFGEFVQDSSKQNQITNNVEQDNCVLSGNAEPEIRAPDHDNEIECELALSSSPPATPSRTHVLSAHNSMKLLEASHEISMESTDHLRAFGPPERVSNQNNHSKRDSTPDDLEQLMQDMASMREHMKTMPDAHRRDMAARFAMRMATMFGEDEDGDD